MTRVGPVGRHQEHARVQTETPTACEGPCETGRNSRQLLPLVAQLLDETVCLACWRDSAQSLAQGGAVALGFWHQDDAVADAGYADQHLEQFRLRGELHSSRELAREANLSVGAEGHFAR